MNERKPMDSLVLYDDPVEVPLGEENSTDQNEGSRRPSSSSSDSLILFQVL